MPNLYFTDIEEGQRRELGSYTVPKEEMMEFAQRYDPQPIHVNEEAASESIFGGVIASGWYTASVCMRLLVDEFLGEAASMGSLGLDELRWQTPVRAGDTLTVSNEILETRLSESRDDRGYVRNKTVAHNQDGEEVLVWVATNIFATN